MNILITGANGFVGSYLLDSLFEQGHMVFPIYRSKVDLHANAIYVDDYALADWADILRDIDVVIHLAGIANATLNDDQAYFDVNVNYTAAVVRGAISAGVNRFIFLSTIKVNGEGSLKEQQFLYSDNENPLSLYAQSKYQAENVLKELCSEEVMDFVIVRPPLIYGPKVKGNFNQLITMAKSLVPLPFADIKSRRDMVSIFNLASLIDRCVEHPLAKNGTFLVSDGQPYSIGDIIGRIRTVYGRPLWLFYFPTSILICILKLLNKEGVAEKLFESLEVDIQHTKVTLDWKPTFTLEDTLNKMSGRSDDKKNH